MKKSTKAFFFIAVTVAIFYLVDQSDEQKNSAIAKAMPQDEHSLTEIVSRYNHSYIYANALQIVPMRRQRAAEICSAITSDGMVKDWVGRVDKISATTNGGAIIEVYVYGNGQTILENWNEKTNANDDKFPISPDSPSFQFVSNLKQYDLIRFDGQLQQSSSDCFRTADSESADESGDLTTTMMYPKFMINFTDVRPFDTVSGKP